MGQPVSWNQLFRQPVSGLTHLAGAFGGAVGLGYFGHAAAAAFGWVGAIPFIVFCVSVMLLYGSSATYHLLFTPESFRVKLRRVDHTMIFVLIAGSYTPFCVHAMRDYYGTELLVLIWAIALAGTIMKLFWLHAPRWLSTVIYIAMGWLSVGAIYPLMKVLSTSGLFWLVAGGLSYTFGAVIYAIKKPDPIPDVFGFHEVWHLFVMAGTACHFVSIATLIP